MYKHGLVAVVAVTLVGSLGVEMPRAQEGVLTGDAARGASVLAEARKALGGDKLDAVTALQLKGSFKRAAGNNQVEGDLEITVQLPDKMKRVEDTSAPGGGPSIVSTQVINGTEVWDENTGRGGFGGFGGGGRGGFGGGGRGGFGGRQGGGAPGDGQPAAGGSQADGGGRGAVDPERLRQALLRQRQGDLERMLVGLLLTTDAPVAWVATAEAPDGKADVLEIKPADGAAMRLFLDESTHMPLMLTWQGAAPQGGRGGGRRGQPGRGPQGAPDQGGPQGFPAPGAQQLPPQGGGAAQGGNGPAAGPRRGGALPVATLQMTFSDYKAVNGVKFPRTITRGVNGQTNEEWSVSSYKLNPSLKADFFAQK